MMGRYAQPNHHTQLTKMRGFQTGSHSGRVLFNFLSEDEKRKKGKNDFSGTLNQHVPNSKVGPRFSPKLRSFGARSVPEYTPVSRMHGTCVDTRHAAALTGGCGNPSDVLSEASAAFRAIYKSVLMTNVRTNFSTRIKYAIISVKTRR